MTKILIIEDDESLARMYKTELDLHGMEVSWLKTGENAVSEVKKEAPTLVLLDIMLPKENGLSILKELKADDETKNVPVFILTNFGSDKNVRTALDSGAEDFILKYKIVPDEVAKKIKDFLGR